MRLQQLECRKLSNLVSVSDVLMKWVVAGWCNCESAFSLSQGASGLSTSSPRSRPPCERSGGKIELARAPILPDFNFTHTGAPRRDSHSHTHTSPNHRVIYFSNNAHHHWTGAAFSFTRTAWKCFLHLGDEDLSLCLFRASFFSARAEEQIK